MCSNGNTRTPISTTILWKKLREFFTPHLTLGADIVNLEIIGQEIINEDYSVKEESVMPLDSNKQREHESVMLQDYKKNKANLNH